LLHLSRSGTVWRESPGALQRARHSFDEHDALVLPRFIAPDILRYVRGQLAHATFEPKGRENLYSEDRLPLDAPLAFYLLFLLNDPLLMRWVEALTGAQRLVTFTGRVYRREAGGDHHDEWHADTVQGRRVGLSINLGEPSFSGGALRLRRRPAREPHFEYANTGAGDAVIFRIDDSLEHVVDRVESGGPRTVFAGWFRTEAQDSVPYNPSSASTGTRRDRGVLASDVVYRTQAGRTQIHCGGRARGLVLDAVGTEVFEAALAGMDGPAIVERLAASYDAPRDQIAAGCDEVLASLWGEGVLVPA